MRKAFPIACLPLLACLAGCETLYCGRGRADAVAREEMARRQVARDAEIARATAQSSEARLQQLDLRVSRLESALRGRADGLSSELASLRSELAALRSGLASEKADREKMRGEIVSGLSGDVAKLLERQRKQLSAAAAVAAASASSQSGYEHKVQPGQTLSEIALAYKVPVEKIRRANDLKGDMIRAGQVLFIPD